MIKIINYIKEMYDKYKVAFYSGLMFTFISHIYFFANRLGNEDDLNFIYFASRTLTSGRFTTGDLVTGSSLAPMIKFVFVLLVISIISVLICDMFNFKSKKSMILTSLVLSTFPSLAMSFSYLFMTEIYMSALLSAVLAVYICVKFKYGFIMGGLLLGYSLGNYQSYIGVATALSILYIIKLIIDGKSTKEVLKTFIKLLTMGIIGIIFYFIVLNVYLKIFNTTLSNYKGANSMGIPPIEKWGSLLKRTYMHFIGYFLGYSFFQSTNFYTIIRIVLIILCFIIILLVIKHNKIYKNKMNTIFLILFLVLMPLAINIVDFMAYQTELSALNIYQYVITYVIALYIIDKFTTETNKRYITYINILSCCLFVFIGWQNFMTTNNYYYKVAEFNEYTQNFNNRLLTRIENTNGYTYDMPIMIVGEKESPFYQKLYDVSDWQKTVNYDQALWGRFIGYEDLYYFNNDGKIFNYINNQLGFKLVRATDEQKEEILKMNEFMEMETWPSALSTKIINGILVIKL